ncbi:MAG: hypothetical protein AAFQ67_05400, partial [Pseudomonadota bacterium]
FGSNTKGSEGYERRVAEIDYIAKEMARRADREKENYILLGDFNIKNTMDETMDALTKAGWILPPQLFPSNLLGNKYYDQIAFQTKQDEMTFISAGAFDFSKGVYLPQHYEHYAPILPTRHRDLKDDGTPKNRGEDKEYYSKRWLTWQMSDHLPLWVELAIDFTEEHLQHNLDDACAARGECAQNERYRYDELGDRAFTQAQPEPPVEIEDKKAKRFRKKRREPKVAPKEKVGVARPDRPFDWAEAWRIFWYVASGKAEKVKALRKSRERAAKDAERAKRRKKR